MASLRKRRSKINRLMRDRRLDFELPDDSLEFRVELRKNKQLYVEMLKKKKTDDSLVNGHTVDKMQFDISKLCSADLPAFS